MPKKPKNDISQDWRRKNYNSVQNVYDSLKNRLLVL